MGSGIAMLRTAAVASLLLGLLVFASGVPTVGAQPAGEDRVTGRGYDAQGRLLWEKGVRSDSDAIAFERYYRHADGKARPGGGGGGSGGGGADPGTDCEPDSFRKASWKWKAPYAATASAHADLFDAAAGT